VTDFYFRTDAIGAASTPPGRSAIGVIRLSGGDLGSILGPLWNGKTFSAQRPRGFYLGSLASECGEPLDEILLVRFEAPHSYTGEDMAEIHCHGNPSIQSRILSALVSRGVRPAEPGEFTFRAFRNGKMSLLQAEAVAELIEARGEWARRNALSALAERGDAWVESLLEDLLRIWAPIEADLEFPSDDLDSIRLADFLEPLRNLADRIADLDSRALRYRKLQEGYRVVLAGEPNVGKSSLLNALLGYARALVTEIPGTTRDTLEEVFDHRGIPIRLIDTAGLGEAKDVLDAHGMERSREALRSADLVVVVVDARVESTRDRPFARNSPDWIPEETPRLWVGNKVDLLEDSSAPSSAVGWRFVSATERIGLEALLEDLAERLLEEKGLHLEERIMLNQRQADSLGKAARATAHAIENIASGANQDLVATDLALAKSALEELSGRSIQVDLLDSIFSRFCIGK